MPTYQLLTDRVLANPTAITPTTLIHIVTTDDVSQNPAGSSYKAELGQLSNLFSGSTFTGNTSASCINELYVSDIYGCSGTTFHDNVCFETIATGTTGYTLSVTEGGCLIIATGTTSEKVVTKDLEVTNTLLGPKGSFTDYMKVSRLKSFSPLFINDEDEGNVHFGSTSGVTIDVLNSRIGIGTLTPSYPLDVISPNSALYYDTTSVGGRLNLSGNTNIPRFDITIPSYLTNPTAGITLGMRTWNDVTYPGYGKVGDGYLYAGNATYGLNLINRPGTGTEDYIRFYAGTSPLSTSDIHIQGSGTTRGYVGMGTETPIEKLHVIGNTIISGTLSGSSIVVTTSYTPSGSTDTNGVPGSISWDNTYIYLKNNTGWVRVSGETW